MIASAPCPRRPAEVYYRKEIAFAGATVGESVLVKYVGTVLIIIFVAAPAINSFARSSHSSSSGDDFGKILALAAALLVGLVFAAINASKKPKRVSQEKVNQLAAEANDFFDKFAATGKLTVPDTL